MGVRISEFSGAQRGAAPLVGLILLFGILILALTMYQAQVVPTQNAAVEFQHFETVQNDLITVRNSVSTVGATTAPQFTGVTLGTNYQMRTLTVNPPPPVGTLRTTEGYNLTVANATTAENVTTRLLEYQPGYFELDAGSLWYEHSVVLVQEENETAVIADPQLVTVDDTFRPTVLRNEYTETSTDRVTLDLYPNESVADKELPNGTLSVKLPTRLNDTDYWESELGDEAPIDSVDVESYPGEDDIYHLNVTVESDEFELNAVAIGS